MKKASAIIVTLILLLVLVSCGSKTAAPDKGLSGSASSDTLETTPASSDTYNPVYSADEYLIYQNVMFNDMAGDYLNKERTIRGIFTQIEDRYSEKTRYYVWGYYDQTKCCDWQWEIAPSNLTGELPRPGSLVEYTGMLVSGAAALDQYWFAGDDSFNVITEFTGKLADVDMTVMNGTLERVQLINMQMYSDWFEGKTVKAYGRVASLSSIQHPYYDGDWQQPFESMDSIPAIGTEVIVSGTFSDAVIKNSSVSETTQF